MQRNNDNRKRNQRQGYQSPAQKAKAAGSNRSRINVTNYDSVTKSLFIPPEMNSVLAAVGGEVTIKLGPGSQSVQITRNGAVIMTEPEVRELSQINQFVKKERKTNVSEKKAGALEALAYKLIAAKRATDKKWDPILIGPNQLNTLRERDAQIQNLGYNLDLISANKQSASKDAKSYLLFVGSCIRNAIAASAISALSEGKAKDIYECTRERLVPRWMVVRLANGKLSNIDATVDLTRLLYPKDFSKGVSVTLEEIRDTDFVGNNTYIFQRSALLAKCLQSDDLVRALLGFDSKVNLDDSTNAEVQRAMKCVVTLSPVDKDLARLAKLLEGRGVTMKWSTRGTVGNYKSTLLAFSHSFIKAFYGLVKGPDPFNTWWRVLFPSKFNMLVRKDFSGINNSVGHWLGQADNVHPTAWDDLVSGYSSETRTYLLEAIRTDLGGFTEGRLSALMKDLLGKEEKVDLEGDNKEVTRFMTGPTNKVDVVKAEEEEPITLARSMTRSMGEDDVSAMKKIRDKYFAQRIDAKVAGTKKGVRGSRGNRDPTARALGTITVEIEAIIRDMDEAVSEETISASLNWLRGFANFDVRKAAAQLLTARFDAFADEEDIDVEVNAEYYAESDDPDDDDGPPSVADN